MTVSEEDRETLFYCRLQNVGRWEAGGNVCLRGGEILYACDDFLDFLIWKDPVSTRKSVLVLNLLLPTPSYLTPVLTFGPRRWTRYRQRPWPRGGRLNRTM